MSIERNANDGAIPGAIGEVRSEPNERLEAARIREVILEGYRDALAGQTVAYRGNLRQLLENERSEPSGQ